MYELELRLSNDLPFAWLSSQFPDLRIYRWCSSMVDYLEIFGPEKMLLQAEKKLKELSEELKSALSHRNLHGDRLTVMMGCRCSVMNSAIRIAESMNFMWEAPASYHKGFETLRLISFDDENSDGLYNNLGKLGTLEVVKKKELKPGSLREVYTVSLSELTGDLTEKQIRYLRDAISMGFFASPKRVMIEDLAAIHKVSKSTMQEHINKARNKLLLSLEPYLNLTRGPDPE